MGPELPPPCDGSSDFTHTVLMHHDCPMGNGRASARRLAPTLYELRRNIGIRAIAVRAALRRLNRRFSPLTADSGVLDCPTRQTVPEVDPR